MTQRVSKIFPCRKDTKTPSSCFSSAAKAMVRSPHPSAKKKRKRKQKHQKHQKKNIYRVHLSPGCFPEIVSKLLHMSCDFAIAVIFDLSIFHEFCSWWNKVVSISIVAPHDICNTCIYAYISSLAVKWCQHNIHTVTMYAVCSIYFVMDACFMISHAISTPGLLGSDLVPCKVST